MSSNSSKSSSTVATDGLGSLIRLLPTGTVFAFQFLNPVATNNGKCGAANTYMSSALIASCGLSCLLSSFTDSYTDGKGNVRYGFVTPKGMWPGSSDGEDLSGYRLGVADVVHAILAVLVFAVVALLDANTVRCLYPSFGSTDSALRAALPPMIGMLAGAIFMIFPNRRHGIGYPSESDDTSASTSSTKP
ncbi:hypothetical protein M569_13572 [Genlisea aurea]|uniref:DUF679 domain membrane protein 2 n=1 Tax=Genlisea aurea TaxID=192259 RepID=S8C3I4_9LAMI|nr:hypothetical protein M569_13572 [Genlisea aurea]